jgi:putative salt-induced outer membrane protein YdiY
MYKSAAVAATAVSMLVSTAAQAQDPGGLLKQDNASSGTTDVAQEGFQAVAKAEAESKDATALTLSAGGLAAAGNASSLFLTGAGDFRLRRQIHQLGVLAAANYGRAEVDADGDPATDDRRTDTTVNNYQGRVRYDLFFAKHIAAFMAVSARHDSQQGLALRLNFDPGVAYYFIDEENHQFSAEVGYDLQHDLRTDEAVELAADNDAPIEDSETRHNARAAVKYDNKLNKEVTLNTGLEYLQGLSPFEDDEGDMNMRIVWGAGLTSSVAEALSVATSLNVAYDNNPLPFYKKTDVLVSVSLVYNLY